MLGDSLKLGAANAKAPWWENHSLGFFHVWWGCPLNKGGDIIPGAHEWQECSIQGQFGKNTVYNANECMNAENIGRVFAFYCIYFLVFWIKFIFGEKKKLNPLQPRAYWPINILFCSAVQCTSVLLWKQNSSTNYHHAPTVQLGGGHFDCCHLQEISDIYRT